MTNLSALRSALSDARKAREEALVTLGEPLRPWTRSHIERAAESAARCAGTLQALIDAEGGWLVVRVDGDVWAVVSRHQTFASAAAAVKRGQVLVRDDWP